MSRRYPPLGEGRQVAVSFPERQLELLEALRCDSGLLDWSDAQAIRYILSWFYSSGLTIRKCILEKGSVVKNGKD